MGFSKKHYANTVLNKYFIEMVYYINLTRIIEKCINDTQYNPLKLLINLSMEHVDNVVKIMGSAIEHFISESGIGKTREKLVREIKNFYRELLDKIKINVLNQINKFVKNESCYINTTDEAFLAFLNKTCTECSKQPQTDVYKIKNMLYDGSVINKMTKMSVYKPKLTIENGAKMQSDDFHIVSIRKLCELYYNTVKFNIRSNVTKLIMCDIVREIQYNIKHVDICEYIFNPTKNAFDDEDIMRERDSIMIVLEKIDMISKGIF